MKTSKELLHPARIAIGEGLGVLGPLMVHALQEAENEPAEIQADVLRFCVLMYSELGDLVNARRAAKRLWSLPLGAKEPGIISSLHILIEHAHMYRLAIALCNRTLAELEPGSRIEIHVLCARLLANVRAGRPRASAKDLDLIIDRINLDGQSIQMAGRGLAEGLQKNYFGDRYHSTYFCIFGYFASKYVLYGAKSDTFKDLDAILRPRRKSTKSPTYQGYDGLRRTRQDPGSVVHTTIWDNKANYLGEY